MPGGGGGGGTKKTIRIAEEEEYDEYYNKAQFKTHFPKATDAMCVYRSSYHSRPKTTSSIGTRLTTISVTQAVQNSLRKYQIERRIFQELLELKRLQIRAGRANEQVLVKRLSDEYAKSISNFVGLKRHDGPYTFKDFEKYLYGEWCISVC